MKCFPKALLLVSLVLGLLLCACVHRTQDPFESLESRKREYRQSGHIQPVLEALSDSDLRIRAEAAAFLGATGDPRAIPALRARLEDRSRYVREEALKALAALGAAPKTRTRGKEAPPPDGSALQQALALGRVYTTQGSGFPLGKTSVRSLDFSPDGRFIAAGYSLGGFVVWDAVEGHLYTKSSYYSRTHYYRVSHYATSVDFAPEGRTFATGEGPSVEVRGMDGESLWRQPHAHEPSAGFGDIGTTVVFSPSEPVLVSAGRDGAVRVWDVSNGQSLARLRQQGAPVTALAFASDGRRLAAGDSTGAVRVWDMETQGLPRTVRSGPSEVTCLAFSRDGECLYAGNMEGDLFEWNMERDEPPKTLRGHASAVKSVVYAPDSRRLASCGEDGVVLLWNPGTGMPETRLEGHGNWVEAVAFSPDASLLATGGKDGTLRLWSASSGQELLKLVNLEFYDWLSVTPSGWFNASPGAAEHVRIDLGGRKHTLAHIFSRCYRPDIVRRSLTGRAVVPVEAPRERNAALPPSVEILSPVDGAEVKGETARVTVSVKDNGGGIASVDLYHNGRNVARQGGRGLSVREERGRTVRDFEVVLVVGENRFQAAASSREGLESERSEIVLFCRRPRKLVDLHVLAVGIDTYRNPDLNLNHAESDARGVAEFFRTCTGGLFQSVRVTELLNEQATGAAIRKTLERLSASSRPQDAVVLYFCGHGETLGSGWYFLPHDVIYPEREEHLRDRGLSSDEMSGLLHRLPARKVLLVMDSCKSGAALVSFRSLENRRALVQLARATGVYVVAASSRDQFAAEVRELGHGIFTYTLLRGLRGEATGDAASTVTVKRLLAYVEEQLPLLSQKHRQSPQYPVVYSRGMDFPIAPGE